MSTSTLACPFCNAQVAPTPGMAAGQRVQCPRCGQVFTLSFTPQDLTPTPSTEGTPTPEPEHPVRGNLRVAAWVLAVMGSMAAIGLVFALWTTKDRRAHDTGVPRPRRGPVVIEPPESTQSVTPLAPARWPALGYLPADTDLVAGVRVAELRERKDARAFLDAPLKIGSISFRLDKVAEKTGLRLEDIDEIVLGARVENPKALRLALVIRTRRPYGDRVRAQLRREQPTKSDGKQLYPLDLLGFPQVLWLPDNQTLVIALLASQLASVPASPAKDLDQLVPSLRAIVKERLGTGNPVWIAGNPESWSKSATDLVLNKVEPEQRKLLRSVQTFAVWVGPEDKEVTLGGAFHCKDDAEAKQLDTALHKLAGEGAPLKTATDAAWLSAQLRLDPDALRRRLKR